MSATPFISDHLSKSKIIAQTQILAIFILALAIKHDTLALLGHVATAALFTVAIFSNLVLDMFLWIGGIVRAKNYELER